MGSSMSIIVVLELGPIGCGSNVVATFSTCNMFCVDFKAKAEPNVATPPFLEKKGEI
jgi:hypothetical protein